MNQETIPGRATVVGPPPTSPQAAAPVRYRAFISYAHADHDVAVRLQRMLEGYSIPRELRGQDFGQGPLPAHLTPIFRDRTDADVGPSVSLALTAALGNSDALIVVCSPAAARSHWVSEEIRAFKAGPRGARVFPVIAGGTPELYDEARAPEGAFPAALEAAPLAPDIREEGDGTKYTMLKLVAALTGVPLTQLENRELIAQRRCVRLYQGIAGAMLVLAVLAGAAAFMAYSFAKRAERMAAAATDIASGFVGQTMTLSDRYGVPTKTVESFLKEADRQIAALFANGVRTDALDYQRARLLMQFAQLFRVQGDGAAQVARMEEAVQIMDGLAKRDPLNPEWRRWLGIAHQRLGSSRTLNGELALAQEDMTEAVAIATALVEREPENGDYRNDLALAHASFGTIYYRLGSVEKSLDSYKSCLAAAEKAVALVPGSGLFLRTNSLCYDQMGDAYAERGDLNAALDAYEKGLALSDQSRTFDPDNSEWLRDGVIGHFKVGDAYYFANQWDEAIEEYEKSLVTAQHLAAMDETNLDWRRDVAVSMARLGDAYLGKEAFERGLEEYTKAGEIFKRLADAKPGSLIYLRDLAVNEEAVGDILMGQGEPDGALGHFRAENLIHERLIAADPDNMRYREGLAIGHYKEADALLGVGNTKEAAVKLEDAVARFAELAERDTQNADWQLEYLISLRTLVDFPEPQHVAQPVDHYRRKLDAQVAAMTARGQPVD